MRTPEGERVLAPGDVVHFPEGEAGTHQFWNDTERAGARPARLVEVGPVRRAAIRDSTQALLPSPTATAMVRDDPALDYWDGEGESRTSALPWLQPSARTGAR